MTNELKQVGEVINVNGAHCVGWYGPEGLEAIPAGTMLYAGSLPTCKWAKGPAEDTYTAWNTSCGEKYTDFTAYPQFGKPLNYCPHCGGKNVSWRLDNEPRFYIIR